MHSTGQQLRISVDPEWVNYDENATVTFHFAPPCQKMVIFKNSPSNCYIGATCLHNPTTDSVRVTESQITLEGQSSEANDFYYGLCSDNLLVYRTSNSTLRNVNIGGICFNVYLYVVFNASYLVKPRVLTIEVDPPNYPPTALNRTATSTGDLFSSNKSIVLYRGDTTLAIGIGAGHNPNPPPYGSDFTFSIPEFTDPSSNNYSFIIPDSRGSSRIRLGKNLDGYSYRYHFSREDLVNYGTCSIKATAVATLAKTQVDRVPFQIDFSFDPIITEISVIEVNDTKTYSFAKPGDCVFTCHAAVCPLAHKLKYEWSFYHTLTPNWDGGNVEGYPHLFHFNASTCKESYTTIMKNRLEDIYRAACKVSGDGIPSTDRAERFFNLLRKFLLTDSRFFYVNSTASFSFPFALCIT